ncbi:mechanosensitive ion channel [Tenacibaculum sp. HL-MS23]|uniref:mechanosensitive ion channel family protein n=1 Tax=unclassified Tenacibaculum TaxID=2635139 RepID=UPI001C500E0F|nr:MULTISPECIES: mechanosensitive ion channel domain-containing protein [unclassified Tenacibaculum]QXP73467.1 mechanosensitive ion channel [Tenacibaculum sp. AHE14PA]QXP74981.1 mechanosensitive ion channel [Tenacibaculum sp. AHE15PA]WNW01520.1 mechanosensitive ion channel [Tenacibaculum sp. HL-MS23]
MPDKFFYNLFKEQLSLSETLATYLNLIANLIVFLVLGFILFRVIRYVGRKAIHKIADKTGTQLDDMLIKNRVFLNFSRSVILVVIFNFIKELLADFPNVLSASERILSIAIIFSVVWFLKSVLNSIKDFLRTMDAFKDKPLDSYVQIFMIALWLISIILSFSVLTGKPLIKFLTALGAFSAVLLLIFKDTILGFVASIQVAVNDTVRIGDWITMDKYGADGDVVEINLTSVIIRNFDNTISSIPTYYLTSDSFKNWRTMSNSGGRRIKRAILIKINSIRFLTESDIENFKKIALITDYINEASGKVNNYNTEHNIDKTVLLNGRNLTNFGSFRVYLDHYIQNHPQINQDMLLMSRQLEPTPNGIPLEIYAFSKEKVWEDYERVMANIFDHILASVKYFDLEIFQNPSSIDIQNLRDLSVTKQENTVREK